MVPDFAQRLTPFASFPDFFFRTLPQVFLPHHPTVSKKSIFHYDFDCICVFDIRRSYRSFHLLRNRSFTGSAFHACEPDMRL